MPCSSVSIVNFEQVNIGWLFVLHPLFFSCRGRRTRALSLNVKLTKLLLQIGCPSYHLIL